MIFFDDAWAVGCSYGPRPSDRWVGFSEEGRLDCDIKMAPFASGQRTKWGQVGSSTSLLPAVHPHNGGNSKLIVTSKY